MFTALERPVLLATVSALALMHSTVPAQSQTAGGDDVLVLDAVIVQGDKVGRTQDEVAPSILILDEAEIDRAINDTVISTINRTGNVVSEEGVQLPAIRGIDGSGGQQQSISAGTQPRVPILVDDVARPLTNSGTISLSSTWDLGSIEIARGPQSSSTGRNALGGAIRVYTNDPVFAFEGALRGEAFTEDGTLSGASMINIPLLEDQLAVRFTAEASRGESFVDVIDPTDFAFDPEREEFERYRGKLLIQPEAIPDLSVLLTADFIRSEGALRGFIDSSPDEATVSSFTNTNAFQVNDQLSYSGRLNYQISDQFELVLRGARIDNDFLAEDVFSGIGAFNTLQEETEFESYIRFSDLGIIDSGVFGYIRNVADEDASNDEPAASFITDGEITNSGVYGEVELDLSRLYLPDGLHLIAGGRFEMDDRTRSVEVLGSVVSDRSFNEERFLPKVGIRYDYSEQLTFGYTYSEGFRPGGVDVDLNAPFLGIPEASFSEFEPETIEQHEVYVRANVFDDRLRLGATAFYYEYTDAQVPGASPVMGVGGTLLTGNLPEAVGRGFEVDASLDFADGFTAIGALGFLDTEITDPGPVLMRFDGADLPRAPTLTGALGLAYVHDAGFQARADARFVGEQVSELGGAEIGSYTVLDLSGGYVFETERIDFELGAYIANVTDNRYFTFRSNVGSPFSQEAIGRPRTFGISLTARF